MDLATFWFVLVAILWIGYLVLEGFDFGVGMLTRRFARDDTERRVLINTIGPVWDGNEVWMVTAVGATFAAFPEWYATAWSSYYLPLVLVLVLLILRGLAFEYRAKHDSHRWRQWWDGAIFWGSAGPAFFWGVLLAGFAQGLPLDSNHDFVGDMTDIITPYTVLGGVVTLLLSVLHGAHYVALKTVGDIRDRARIVAARVAVLAVAVTGGFATWTVSLRGDGSFTWLAMLTGGVTLGLLAAGLVITRRREGWAFAASFAAIAGVGIVLFASLYPQVVPSTVDASGSLTVAGASSTEYTLTVMTWVAVPLVPLVLLYQGWVYWTFRRRIGIQHIAPAGASQH
ncbi:cytochrome d ubiquinol oxidase subunit II [Actinobacteria bacterium YIM 96077]|uniref:Cytochrome d ubiquinol oxidase subunit II n=1 Tax=Phytoactinopolyspora halophila TaxID=1981511 RepID=A0A329QGG9_9ACTN|nr:cytochrome d ubiquinol oxidase subunit II [Phytoactinopolyspora halophila]AYY14495.1 cytochrome d ubiquinol oxidase subunit II [Actinobacteria bacterium YIM 96077]RAW11487.1 cytochrome d ubiquinol oxidase subunit II [Phytoactinopolyspora halophila]